MLPLERPVLSLTIDAVVKMNGEDALCGLLTLFHKCKEGLQDGDRLENMAWRLWHVERLSSQICIPASAALSSPGHVASPLTSSSLNCSEDESEVSSDGETRDQDQTTTVQDFGVTNDKAPSPTSSKSLSPLPDVSRGTREQCCRHDKPTRRSPSAASATSRQTSRSRRPSLASRRTHSNTSIGQIMADLLPEKLDLYRPPSLNTLAERDTCRKNTCALSNDEGHVPAVVVMPDVPLEQPRARPSPPTSVYDDRPMRFPTVVIVNPTPHPTPPRTPQVSPPPASPPTTFGLTTRRDTLKVVTSVHSPTSPTLPPTPESIEEHERADKRHLSALSEAKAPVSGPRSSSNSGSNSGGQSGGTVRAGKGTAVHNSPNMRRLGASLSGGHAGASSSSLNPYERKFFISQVGSPDADSPDTSASSQVGSQTALSASVATSVLDKKAEEAAAAYEPTSVASRISAGTARSHSSNGSSSRSGEGRMKSRTGTSAKGKGKEIRQGHALSAMHRVQSSSRIHRLQTGPGGLTGGTIQRSKLGGRTAVASAHAAALASSHFGKPQNVRHPTSGATMHPPPPTPVSKPTQAEKPTQESSTGNRAGASKRRGLSSRRSSKSGSSAKGVKVNGNGNGNGNVAPSSSLKQKRLDFADDSDYTTDTEWDTDDASEGADGTENEQVATDRKLAEAAAEAQRQRDMFAKVDRRSYQDLSRVRTQPGLLSAIFHPDPELFPPNHPYRHSRSTQDILAHVDRPLYQPPPLQPSRATTAGPVAAAVTAQGVGSPIQAQPRQRSPLRLRGRPQDVEESESGEEDDNNTLHVSESVAQERLAMLQRQSTKSTRPQERPTLPQQPTVLPSSGQPSGARYGVPVAGPSPLSRVATEPIPLGYPYNLPPPMPPSTPRTTRRNMLTHELPESLRRNLLWERQVSKQRPLGRRAVTSATGPSNLRPITNVTVTNGQGETNNSQSSNSVASSPADVEQKAKEERQQKVLARNRTWADTFHVTGW